MRKMYMRYAVFVVAALGATVTVAHSRSRDLEPGSYRAVLESPGGELPFGLDVAREESGLVLYLVNGKERVRVPEVIVEAGKLTARMPGYENAITATISTGRGTSGFAAGAGSVWVTSTIDGTVSRIDPGSAEVVDQIDVGGRPREVAVGADGVWVTADAS